jgi:hypothetical protein
VKLAKEYYIQPIDAGKTFEERTTKLAVKHYLTTINGRTDQNKKDSMKVKIVRKASAN